MNLSTSNSSSSSSSRGDYRAILLALATLLAVEGAVRFLEPSLSADVRNIEGIPQELSELAATPGEHMLFLGNSLTREGVDMKVLRPELAARQVELQKLNFGFVYPDSADILDWFYVYRHNVSEANRPDLLLLSFASDGLADETRPDAESVRRLARHHTTLADTPYVFAHDLTRLSERGDFLVSKLFVSFAHRERVRARALDEAIPNYRETQRALSQTDTPVAAIPAAPPEYTYERLTRFLKLVNTEEVEVIFVAMPIREAYTLDPKLGTLIASSGARLLELASVPQLTPAHFRDGLHLTPAGAKIYSKVLGRELAPLLSKNGKNPSVLAQAHD